MCYKYYNYFYTAGYVSPLAQAPVAAGSADPATPKTVDYSNYYSTYGKYEICSVIKSMTIRMLY